VAFSAANVLRSAERRKTSAFLKEIGKYVPEEVDDPFFAWPDGSIVTAAGATAKLGQGLLQRRDQRRTLQVPVVVLA